MPHFTDHPAALAILCALLLWLSTRLGAALAPCPDHSARNPDAITPLSSFLILAAALVLLGLLIGMTLATTSARHTQRALLQQQEAAAIRSACIRAQLLPATQATALRSLLAPYLQPHLASTPLDAVLAPRLWQVLLVPTPTRRIAASTLVMQSLNNVFAARALAQRAWSTRLSATGWLLLIALAVLIHILAGLAITPAPRTSLFLILVPTLIAVSFYCIAKLDLPASPDAHSGNICRP